jgi:hypothetical protein
MWLRLFAGFELVARCSFAAGARGYLLGLFSVTARLVAALALVVDGKLVICYEPIGHCG